MEPIEHAQTILPVSVIQKLKQVTGTGSTKQALQIAVEHTIATYKPQKERKA